MKHTIVFWETPGAFPGDLSEEGRLYEGLMCKKKFYDDIHSYFFRPLSDMVWMLLQRESESSGWTGSRWMVQLENFCDFSDSVQHTELEKAQARYRHLGV